MCVFHYKGFPVERKLNQGVLLLCCLCRGRAKGGGLRYYNRSC
ncbi:hypothetical protein AWB67_07031 [Caballeronia terrestris]|jgi:hypothetical protein|uniref:Uncharacterized protein n=1 Tax=Caballeronia terrestris TaxID=1226301 RepID=A0A158KXD5_9BURK|nr:hypothetical protein AWB67_07031 [Caballeronia terrestris]